MPADSTIKDAIPCATLARTTANQASAQTPLPDLQPCEVLDGEILWPRGRHGPDPSQP
jgi:hypothetical protein